MESISIMSKVKQRIKSHEDLELRRIALSDGVGERQKGTFSLLQVAWEQLRINYSPGAGSEGMAATGPAVPFHDLSAKR